MNQLPTGGYALERVHCADEPMCAWPAACLRGLFIGFLSDLLYLDAT
jgi:hypothetical protein